MNVLITGVNGFIGQHVSRFLTAKHNVFGVTRSSASTHSQAGITMVFADLSDPAFVDFLPPNINCIIHLAQSQRYRDFPDGADDIRRINIDATCKLLEWARKTRVKQFIFTSSANVYGKSTAILTESNATQPESFYGASKLAAEHLVRQYREFFQVDILRLFTVYGPGQKGMLIPNIIERMRTGQPITLAEGVGLYLTPVYVGDVVAIIEMLIETPSKATARLLNVCGDKVIRLCEIVSTIEFVIGTQARTQFTDEKTQYFTGSNAALKELLGPLSLTDIETGLAIAVKDTSGFH